MRAPHSPALLAALLAAGIASLPAVAQSNGQTMSLAGKVIHVDDGDTLTMLDAQQLKWVIRLTDIDAPESGHGTRRPGQPFSGKAAALLKSLALGKQATATCYDIDNRHTRTRYVCRVFVDGTDTNMAMLDAGLAMAYRQQPRYVRDQASYQHEEAARAKRLGIWSLPAPVPPWDWRKACWTQGRCEGAGD